MRIEERVIDVGVNDIIIEGELLPMTGHNYFYVSFVMRENIKPIHYRFFVVGSDKEFDEKEIKYKTFLGFVEQENYSYYVFYTVICDDEDKW